MLLDELKIFFRQVKKEFKPIKINNLKKKKNLFIYLMIIVLLYNFD
jgi:hypothetical protein